MRWGKEGEGKRKGEGKEKRRGEGGKEGERWKKIQTSFIEAYYRE
jgi:hypothetical protein